MSFAYVCTFTKEGWRCEEKLLELQENGIYTHDLPLWDAAKLSLDNDRISYEKVRSGDPKIFKNELLRHYNKIQNEELERWKLDEKFLKVYGKVGSKNRVTELNLKPMGEDFWNRKIFKNIETGTIYAKVDGRLHPCTSDGEPIAPIRKDIKVNIQNKGVRNGRF